MNRTARRRAAITARLLALALVLGASAPAAGQTVAEAVRAALATNPTVGVVAADREAVEQELRQARALYMPSLDLRGLLGPQYRDEPTVAQGDRTLFRAEAQLTLTQLLFDGFATQSEVQRQRARLDSAAYRVAEAAEFIALDAIEAYLNVLRSGVLVELADENIGSHERILGQVRRLVQEGIAGIGDARQAEARLAATQATSAEARRNQRDAAAAYARVVGVAPETLLWPQAPAEALPAEVEAALVMAGTENPTVRIARADVDVAAAALDAARAGYYPTVTAELGATSGHDIDEIDGRNLRGSALLVLRYNLFRGGADIAREREAFARIREARRLLDVARRQAEEEILVSYSALVAARERVEALGDQVEANLRTRDVYADQFLLGQRGLLDLLDVENELFVSRSGLVTAEATRDFGVYRALAVAGLLLDELEVDRPPEAIDIYRRPREPLAEEAVAPAANPPASRPTAAAGASPPAPVPALRPVPRPVLKHLATGG